MQESARTAALRHSFAEFVPAHDGLEHSGLIGLLVAMEQRPWRLPNAVAGLGLEFSDPGPQASELLDSMPPAPVLPA
jgi:hypothetical protein